MLTIIIAVWLLVAVWAHGWASCRRAELSNLLVFLWPPALVCFALYLIALVIWGRWRRWAHRNDRAPRIITRKPAP